MTAEGLLRPRHRAGESYAGVPKDLHECRLVHDALIEDAGEIDWYLGCFLPKLRLEMKEGRGLFSSNQPAPLSIQFSENFQSQNYE